MRYKIQFAVLLLASISVLHFSCQKEISCEGCVNGNKPPIAIAGSDQVITLPTDSVLLDGRQSSDPDGTISSYLWTKISGPVSFTINSTSAPATVIKNLTIGIYQVELKVTDDKGLSAKDTMQIIVNDPTQPNRPPIANAGIDQTTVLPRDSVLLNGNASSDPDDIITSYKWAQIAGPSSSNIITADSSKTIVKGLAKGVFKFELTVTDNGGLSAKDTMLVTVNEGTFYVSCDSSNRELISAQLIPFATIPASTWQNPYGYWLVAAGSKLLCQSRAIWSGSSSPIYIYDFGNQNWSQVELSIPRRVDGIAVLGNKIYFGGGVVTDGINYDSIVSTIDVYNAVSNSWSVSSLSQPRYCDAAAAIGDKVLFNGRFDFQVYNTVANNCTTAPISISRYGGSATAAGNKVYFAGGFPLTTGTGSVSDRIDVYDNTTNAWSYFSLQEPKAQLASIAANNKIFWAGGYNSYNTTETMSSLVEIYDVNTNTSTTSCLFQPNAGFQAVRKGNKIVFFIGGGGYIYGQGFNKFDIYDLSTGVWSIGVLPVMLSRLSIISFNNTIYVVGEINGNASNQVWKLEF